MLSEAFGFLKDVLCQPFKINKAAMFSGTSLLELEKLFFFFVLNPLYKKKMLYILCQENTSTDLQQCLIQKYDWNND